MKHSTANLALVTVALSWGVSYPLMKIISAEMPSFSIISARFIITVLLMLIFFHKRIKKPKLPLLINSGIGGSIVAFMILFILCAVRRTDASTVGFLISSSVAFVVIINTILTRKLPSLPVGLGLLAVLGGLYLLSGTGGLEFNVGAMFAVLAAITYAIHIHFTNIFSPRFDSINFGFWQMMAVAIVASVTQYFMGEGFCTPHTTKAIVSLVILAMVCTFFCFSLQIAAQKYSTAQETGLIFTLEPISSAFYAWMILDERMNARGILGAIIAILGVIACMYFSGKRPAATVPEIPQISKAPANDQSNSQPD